MACRDRPVEWIEVYRHSDCHYTVLEERRARIGAEAPNLRSDDPKAAMTPKDRDDHEGRHDPEGRDDGMTG